jgi:hypothetical protein
MFVYVPELLLDGTWWGIALAFGTATAGVTALASAGVGFGRRLLTPLER